jgi:predicted Zn-dependent protease
MTGTGPLTKGLADVKSLWADAKYDRALERVEELRRTWPGNAHLHVLAAQLVQLAEEPTQTLDDAKRTLQQAVELDKGSPVAAIELGHFLDNVEDDPTAAAKTFALGVAAAKHALIDGLLGQAKSLLQLDKREDALRCLVEAFRLADEDRSAKKGPFAVRIEELFHELGQMQSA